MAIDRGVFPLLALGHELECDMPVQSRVLGLPHDTHTALADLLDQAVVEQLLSGLHRHFAVLHS